MKSFKKKIIYFSFYYIYYYFENHKRNAQFKFIQYKIFKFIT